MVGKMAFQGMCSSRDDEDDRVYLTPNGPDEKKVLESKFAKICNGYVRSNVQVGPTTAKRHFDISFHIPIHACSPELVAESQIDTDEVSRLPRTLPRKNETSVAPTTFVC